MAKDFLKIITAEGEPVYVNRAYVVKAQFNADTVFTIELDRAAAHMSIIKVHHNSAKEVRDWLLDVPKQGESHE